MDPELVEIHIDAGIATLALNRPDKRNALNALAPAKGIRNQSFEHSLEEIFASGSQAQGICYTSAEHRDSVTAFLQKSVNRSDKS